MPADNQTTEAGVFKEAAEYQAAIADLDDCFRRGIRAFAAWYATEWQLNPAQWKREFADPVPGGEEWFAGYNAGVEGVILAADSFLDEQHP